MIMTSFGSVETAVEAMCLGATDYVTKPLSKADLTHRLQTALRVRGLRVVFQPIVWAVDNAVYGQEALVRSDAEALPTPGDLLHAAERLNDLHPLGRGFWRRRRPLVHQPAPARPLDEALYSPDESLTQQASRVVLEIGKDLGILVVTEGIETLEERDVVVDLGCDLLQGFLFGRPQ